MERNSSSRVGQKKASGSSSSSAVAAKKLAGSSEDEAAAKGTAKKKRRTYPYTKCSCVYCNVMLSCKSSLNRHLASCSALKHLLEVSPQSVSLTDVLTRKHQLELVEKIKAAKKENATFTTCSFCSDVIDKKSMKLHLSKVHNFPVEEHP